MKINMDSPRYKILFVDIDGTLAPWGSRVISGRDIHSLKLAQEAGVEVVYCTGRTRYSAFSEFGDILPETRYMVAVDGAIVWDLWQNRALYRKKLPKEVWKKSLDIALEHDCFSLCFAADEADDGRIYVEQDVELPEPVRQWYDERFHWVSNLTAEIPGDPMTVQAYGRQEAINALAEAWKEEFGAPMFVYTWPARGFDIWGILIHPVEVNKALGASYVTNLLGIPREQTMAIGNDINDLELLEWAGWGVCVEDGLPAAVRKADAVTLPSTQSGVSEAVRRYLLAGC